MPVPRWGPLGQMADYVAWQTSNFRRTWHQVTRREQLWRRMGEQLRPGAPLLVLEFGVAWGYATSFWLDNILFAREDVEWHGFDRFIGLPRAWRKMQEGAFDAGGKPPDIVDPRVTWHVGDLEDTLPGFDLERPSGYQRLVLFDLDIYEPTALAWDALSPFLQPGDLLYFDEAFDRDERRVLDELVLPSGNFRHLGSTAQSLGLEELDTGPSAV